MYYSLTIVYKSFLWASVGLVSLWWDRSEPSDLEERRRACEEKELKSLFLINNKSYKSPDIKKKMTLIIGLKCKEGVIIVSDRKVTNYASNKPKYITKIHKPLENVTLFYGASGYAHLFKEFNRRIPLLVQQRIREFELHNYATMKKQGVDYYETLDIEEDKAPKELQSSDVEGSKTQLQKPKKNIEYSQKLR